jgi:uncharacterized membrane protein
VPADARPIAQALRARDDDARSMDHRRRDLRESRRARSMQAPSVMTTIRKSISIGAPVERVFDYVTDPRHLPEVWPNMVEISKVARHADGGSGFDWTYRMAGIKVRGHSEDIEFARNQRVVSRSESGIPNTFRWFYAAKDGTTELTIEVDYDPPTSLFGRMVRPLLDRINDRDATTLLRNLKAHFEAPSAVA